jgi:(1->4)-alpha-D-glucan 1-alpha-D-glucosylmutase
VQSWFSANARWRGELGPDPATELLLYQTLVGAHPLPVDRAWTYLQKAMREAKSRTSWVDPNEDFEGDVRGFLEGILSDDGFRRDLEAFVAPLVAPGRINALAQRLVAMCQPGVPDVYQGQELWDLSLVDPDNRRPVDYERRAGLLARVDEADVAARAAATLASADDDGLAKLLVVHRALAVRAERPDAFGPDSTYLPLVADGPDADHVVAFARGVDGGDGAPGGDRLAEVVVVVPRRPVSLAGRAPDATVTLPPGEWDDVFLRAAPSRSGPVATGDLLARFPVALLTRRS